LGKQGTENYLCASGYTRLASGVSG